MLLSAEKIGVTFGGLQAVLDFNLKIDDSEIVGLIGPNGAGKTTIFNLITGVYTPTEGNIYLNDKNITGKTTNKINNMGIARTFQNIRLFKKMSVIDNVKVGCHHNMSYNEFQGIFRMPIYKKQEEETTKKALDILKEFGLDKLAYESSENLSYGNQRKLEMARALATNPKLLLLDEPAAGMNPSETTELIETIKIIKNKYKLSVLLIEHDMNLVMNICERLVVLEYGSIIATGLPHEIRNNKRVIAAYLGV